LKDCRAVDQLDSETRWDGTWTRVQKRRRSGGGKQPSGLKRTSVVGQKSKKVIAARTLP